MAHFTLTRSVSEDVRCIRAYAAGEWFFVMELVEGAVEFQDYLLSEGPLSESVAGATSTEVSSPNEALKLAKEAGSTTISKALPALSVSASKSAVARSCL